MIAGPRGHRGRPGAGAGGGPELALLALSGIATAGQLTIEQVAGPVGEALWMTAVGLAVAIPAVLRHWRSLALAVPHERLPWLNSMVFRGMTAMPLRVAS